MKILFVTSEVAPFRKFGGLGDFSASLPKALEKIGVNVDIILPYYSDIKLQNLKSYKSLELLVSYNNKSYPVEIYKTKLPESNVDVLLLKSDFEFSGDLLAETEYFAFYDKCVVSYVESQYNTYDIIHCNDWHTGFITHLLQDSVGHERPKTLVSIHNIGYQGLGSVEIVKEMGIRPGQHPLIDWDISNGDLSMLFQAITSSDYINTVSPTYAKELLTVEYGGELAYVIQAREGRFEGILNGIDYSALPRDYDVSNWKAQKLKKKQNLQKILKLEQSSVPLFAFISRLDPNQKGLEILLPMIEKIVNLGGQFVLLGSGDPAWEQKFAQLVDTTSEENIRNNVSINIQFDATLALDIYSGSDFFLVPSKYEPCGLTQMISMWYGSLPIVRNTGGLKDSVKQDENGIIFDNYSTEDFDKAIEKAFNLYTDESKYKAMVENALTADFGWAQSAMAYKKLYEKMLNE